MRRKLIAALIPFVLVGCSAYDAPPEPFGVVNEFPLERLRVLSIERDDESAVVTATLNVLRHTTDPNTFAPTDLAFRVSEAATGYEVPSASLILSTIPEISVAEVTFQTELLAADLVDITRTEFELTVSLGNQSAQTRFFID